MSAERYYTTIKTDEMSARDGIPHYRMLTQSYPEEVSATEKELRTELIREGRIYQPIKWAGRVGFTAGIIYIFAGATGHSLPNFFLQTEGPNYAQIMGGTFLWLLSHNILEIFGNTLSSWESKKQEFDRAFPTGKIDLIPERFHPTNLLRRINPLQLIHKDKHL